MSKMEVKIEYTRNWCDYLTPCPHFADTEVGSYGCVEECMHCRAHIPAHLPERKPMDYARYRDIAKGIVMCDHPE